MSRQKNLDALAKDLENVLWDKYLEVDDHVVAFDNLYGIFNSMYNIYRPKKKLNCTQKPKRKIMFHGKFEYIQKYYDKNVKSMD